MSRSEQDLGVAIDGSFVETTSKVAAQALAKHYAQQDADGDYYVQTRRVGEKLIYRIRPRSRTGVNETIASSSSETKSPGLDPTSSDTLPTPQLHSKDGSSSSSGSAPRIALQHPTPRKRTAISESQSSTSTSIHDGKHEKDRLGSSDLFETTSRIHRSESQPILPSVANSSTQNLKRSLTTRHISDDQSDVLGRILGWSSRGTAQLTQVLAGHAEEAKDEQDKSDLPPDLVDELEGKPSESTPTRRGLSRSSSSPFGAGVRLANSTAFYSRRSPTDDGPAFLLADLPQPRAMREVASSDSIRTAKAEDNRPRAPSPPLPRFMDWTAFDLFQALDAVEAHDTSRDSRDHRGRLQSTGSANSILSNGSRTTAHEITVLSSPGDDPRFVIWGIQDSSGRARTIPTTSSSFAGEGTRISAGPNSPNERRRSLAPEVDSPLTSQTGSPATSSSSRWSLGQRRMDSPATSIRGSVGSTTSAFMTSSTTSHSPQERVLMAATVERIIAELTSQIKVDLLADFFLTYRSFLRPIHLLQCLITRFDWAMQPPSTPADDAARRIVRVRTFVVVRHWLLNYFMIDFYPDRELRTELTNWLNREGREPAIKASPKDQRLIKGLKKLVRRLKEMHVALGPNDTNEAKRAIARHASKSPALSDEEEVDLDIGRRIATTQNSTTLGLGARASDQNRTSVFGGNKSTRPTSTMPLPGSHSAVARSLTNALGTLGRFKRMLGNRSHLTVTTGTGGSASANTLGETSEAVEFEQNDTGDLLWIKDGLARYLDYHNIRSEPEERLSSAASEVTPVAESSSSPPVPALDEEDHTGHSDSEASPSVGTPHDSFTDDINTVQVENSSFDTEAVGLGLSTQSTATPTHFSLLPQKSQEFSLNESKMNNVTIPIFEPTSFDEYDASQGYYGRSMSPRLELDDVDLSDEDEDVVEVKKTLKRLPGAANLRLVAHTPRAFAYRNSNETESSYGSPRRPSFAGHDRDTVAATWVDEDDMGRLSVNALPGLEGFLLEELDDSDEEEPGDVEAALRRLEGIVDDSREQEKAKKVERQMEKSERKKKGLPIVDDDDEAVNAGEIEATTEQPGDAEQRAQYDPAEEGVVEDASPPLLGDPVPASSSLEEDCEAAVAPPHVPKSAAEEALPTDTVPHFCAPRSLGRREGRPTLKQKPSMNKLFGLVQRPLSTRPHINGFLPGHGGNNAPSSGPTPPRHRSFLLHCRTEVLARQFCLIERDMLRVLGWQELVSGTWRDRSQPQPEVLDWESYLKERRRTDLAAKESGEMNPNSAVQAVIARFNLSANWVASEIVLTANADERVALIAKFIRLAFKCYCQSNFQTLTQIIHGLQLSDVERLKKTWARVPSWELRKFRGMQIFVSHLKNFKHLREVTNSLIAEYGPPGQRGPAANDPYRTAASKGTKSSPTPLGCIPFLGLFLRDLTVNAELPTFLDPSSTHAPAHVDEQGSLVSVADPDALDSLPSLPLPLELRPLVNVHKFRVQARIVQEVLASKEFAEGYPYEPEARWYLKCLKLRSLPANVVSELSRKLE